MAATEANSVLVGETTVTDRGLPGAMMSWGDGEVTCNWGSD